MSLMDVARGAYTRSPRMLRRSLAPLVALVPTRLKFGDTYRTWRGRIARAHVDPAYASAEHLRALRALVAKAHAGSPFYRDLIDKACGPGFDLSSFSLADLEKLPVLGKAELRVAGESALAVQRHQVDRGDTSGSNGEKPFSFYLDKDRSAREMAFVYDCWARVGFDETTPKAVLRGFAMDERGQRVHEWEPALRELRLSVYPLTRENVERYLDLIDEYGVRYIYGYPSAMEVICRHLKAIGRTPRLPIKAVLPISEPLFAHQRRIIRAVLGEVGIAAFYGLSEKVLFATELEDESEAYAFNPLYGVAELVDEEGRAITTPGAEGRLVGTGFLSTGMPFIRYDTGDRATLLERPSDANGQVLKVRELIPRRKPGYLIAQDGSRVVMVDFTPEDPAYFEGIEEFQFHQDTPGICTIKYITFTSAGDVRVREIATDLERKAQHRITFEVLKVDQIAGRAGKRAFIDQRLDISRY